MCPFILYLRPRLAACRLPGSAHRVQHLSLCWLIQKSELRSNLGQGNLEGKVGVRSSGPQSGVAERAPALYLSVSVSREGALVSVPGLQGAWYPLVKA